MLAHYKPVDSDEHPLQQNPRAKKINPYVFGPLQANDDNWGLGDLEFMEFPERVTSKSPKISHLVQGKRFVRHYKIGHLLNILRFAVSSPGLRNFKEVRTILSLYRRYLRKGYDQ